MDIVTYALCKKIASGAVSGVSSMSVQDQTLIIECVDGTHLEMNFPTPVSIVDADIDSNGHLILYMSDGSEIDAGLIPGGGGGSGALEDDLTTSVTVGGIRSGTTYEEGTTLEKLFRDMLNPVAYPTLTNPSATLSATGDKLLEVGATLNTTFTLAFSRGSINPAYGTSGYRAGEATSYTFDGETKASNQFTRVITEAKTSYQGSVSYAQGEQPKDSTGANYNSPLPAGSVNSSVVSYEFVNAMYANTANIASVAKLSLVSKNAKTYTFVFPAQTVANPEEFHIDSSWNITAIESLNTLSGQWENCANEFTQGTTTHDDAAGNPVSYKTFTDNRGYNAGSRKVRVKWS